MIKLNFIGNDLATKRKIINIDFEMVTKQINSRFSSNGNVVHNFKFIVSFSVFFSVSSWFFFWEYQKQRDHTKCIFFLLSVGCHIRFSVEYAMYSVYTHSYSCEYVCDCYQLKKKQIHFVFLSFSFGTNRGEPRKNIHGKKEVFFSILNRILSNSSWGGSIARTFICSATKIYFLWVFYESSETKKLFTIAVFEHFHIKMTCIFNSFWTCSLEKKKINFNWLNKHRFWTADRS